MTPIPTHSNSSLPQLHEIADVPKYLGWFFNSGRSAPRGPARITEGLWTLLTWCWSRSHKERAGSGLCHALIREPGRWLEEADVLEAMGRDSATGNPSRLPAIAIGPFVEALLGEGEAVRGRRAHLLVHIEFRIPRFHEHPHLTGATIAAALRRAGMDEQRLRYHQDAVHPELDAYRGIWEISIADRLRQIAPPAQGTSEETSCTIPLETPEFGRRSRVSLRLHHQRTLSAYFRLNLLVSPDTP